MKNQKYFNLILFVVLYIAVLFLYGVWPERWLAFPGSVDFGVPSITLSQIFYNDHLGFPFGAFCPEGLPFYSTQYLLSFVFSISEYISAQIVLASILLFSLFGIIKLLSYFKVHHIVAILMGFVFMILPINNGHIVGYPPLALTMMLTPLFIWIDLTVFHTINSGKWSVRLVLGIVILLLAKIISIFGNAYPFVFYNFVSGFFVLGYLLKNRLVDLKKSLYISSLYVCSNLLAVFIYKWYVPGGASYFVESIDFFRGQGVDISTLFLPGTNLFFMDIFNLSVNRIAAQFYGDGSNMMFNYLGVSFLLLIIFGFYHKLYGSFLLKSAFFATLFALFISLGPSLKINDLKQDYIAGAISYTMPASDATCSLGTESLFMLPPFNNMRSVYRWIFIPKLFLLIFGAITLTYFITRTRFKNYTYLLFIFIFMETLPNISYSMHLSSVFYSMGHKFKEDVTDQLKPWMLKDKLVYFYSNENDFLARVIGNRYKSFVYNINGDKNFGMAKAIWPKEITDISKCSQNCNDLVYSAMKSGKLDVFIIPKFNMRWDFYSWPPQIPTINDGLFNHADSRFVITEKEYFVAITQSDLINIDTGFKFYENLDAAELKNQNDMDCPWGKTIAVIPLDESSSERGIFTASENEVSYSLLMPKDSNYILSGSVGYLPVSKKWNVSDGTRVLILFSSTVTTDTLFNEYIMPSDDFKPINIPLNQYVNTAGQIVFKTTQDLHKNSNGDWIFWQSPKISKKQ